MSEQPAAAAGDAVPVWTFGDRLRKALSHSDTSFQEMAEYLGVSRNTVSNYVNDHIPPTSGTVRLWTLRTGVPFPWLCHGTLESCTPQIEHRKMRLSDGQSYAA
jgi:transcriptional regulator with XRE-family HTH domain